MVKKPARPSAGSKTAGPHQPPGGSRKIGRPSKKHRAPYDIETVTDAAVRVFNRHGYEAASMEDVARETGITKSSLYYHVSGKEELLARALERGFKWLLGVLEEPGARNGTPLERLRHIVYRSVIITLGVRAGGRVAPTGQGQHADRAPGDGAAAALRSRGAALVRAGSRSRSRSIRASTPAC